MLNTKIANSTNNYRKIKQDSGWVESDYVYICVWVCIYKGEIKKYKSRLKTQTGNITHENSYQTIKLSNKNHHVLFVYRWTTWDNMKEKTLG